jgi:ferredoxin-NADP reductase
MTFQTMFKGREEVAERTMAFHFKKPRDFTFKPGQALELILPKLASADAQSNRHAFSIVSAAFEDRLTITTRMRDSQFKRTLGSLPVGAPVELDGPFGALTLHNNRARPALFIAGGIGITPFVCMLRQAAKDRLPQRFVLIYSNRRPEDAAFFAELLALEKQIDSFQLIATMTRAGTSGPSWSGRTGAIDSELLREVTGGLSSPICYVAGPPALVESMRNQLNLAGVDDDDIRSEDFFGY